MNPHLPCFHGTYLPDFLDHSSGDGRVPEGSAVQWEEVWVRMVTPLKTNMTLENHGRSTIFKIGNTSAHSWWIFQQVMLVFFLGVTLIRFGMCGELLSPRSFWIWCVSCVFTVSNLSGWIYLYSTYYRHVYIDNYYILFAFFGYSSYTLYVWNISFLLGTLSRVVIYGELLLSWAVIY